jgi:hypothetical protein
VIVGASESSVWPVFAGVVIAIPALYSLRTTRGLDRRVGGYRRLRAVLYVILGAGIALLHLAPSAGGVVIAVALVGLFVTGVLKLRLLRSR